MLNMRGQTFWQQHQFSPKMVNIQSNWENAKFAKFSPINTEAEKIANKFENSGLYESIKDDVKPIIMQLTDTPLVDIKDKKYEKDERKITTLNRKS